MNKPSLTLSLTTLLAIALPASADVTLPSVFGDAMVLQRNEAVPVWGQADPGERVLVMIDGQAVAETQADANGRWRVDLAAMPAGGPHELTVQGDNTLTLTDVLVGEVWLCGGQSNMEFAMSRSDSADDAIAKTKRPTIRLFTVKHATSDEPLDDCEGQWSVADAETIAEFSAVGFHFGVALQEELDVPIGLVQCTWGGTPAEAWISAATMQNNPALADTMRRHDAMQAQEPADRVRHEEALARWQAARDAGETVRAPRLPMSMRLNRQRYLLYNAMVAPLAPYRFRGVIWYQGESNGPAGHEYHSLLTTLLAEWRDTFETPELPFGIVQLANFNATAEEPLGERSWTDVREAQLEITENDPHAGLAVTIDVGNPTDIHPKNKRTVGERLSRWALGDVYGKDIAYRGPRVSDAIIDGDTVTLHFDHGDGLKSADGADELPGFEVAGADQVFHPATATIIDGTIRLQAEEVSQPLAVRYGWWKSPTCTLVNEAGLPASPFRTDDWPLQ